MTIRGTRPVVQTPDPEVVTTEAGARIERPTLGGLLTTLGEPDAPTTQVAEGVVRVSTAKGVADVGALEVDPRTPSRRGWRA